MVLHAALEGGTLPSCDNGDWCALNVVIEMNMRYFGGPWALRIVIMVRTARYHYLAEWGLLKTPKSR